MNSYSPTTDDYTRVLSSILPFPFYIFHSMAYSGKLVIQSPTLTTSFNIDQDFYSLIAHILSYYQSNHPELFI